MSTPVFYNPPPPPDIPPKIKAALSYIEFCWRITTGGGHREVGQPDSSRKMTSGEQRCYDAALTTMTEYFNSEGFGDDPKSPPGDGNQPTMPKVPVPVK